MDEGGKDPREDDSTSEQKLTGTEGRGPDGSIPGSAGGVGIGAGTEPNTFEPEDDPDATADAAEDIEDSSPGTSEPGSV
ncbi:hypothetical protein [Arthrobacter sp. ISL-65]|uniref:hypothetical protein n=1 Tax=Arthrobacter sp. ISL-65 TaxID=2819112 RepID=UPI001BE5CFB0|nr:hypothetical protein [Arthrobacter sp. ISL-65]MBT2550986.1 hypothetical protein [Arthrobacter sp. ISL-65]